ncbi:unnamed protein product, partial [Trichobilharzia regenti]
MLPTYSNIPLEILDIVRPLQGWFTVAHRLKIFHMSSTDSKLSEVRTLIVPKNRRTPVRSSWPSIKTWKIFMKPSSETRDSQHLQKGCDFVNAFLKGFKYEDALAVVRIDGIYVDSFHIMDVNKFSSSASVVLTSVSLLGFYLVCYDSG